MIAVRRIRADEWRELRDLRLRALAEAPQAFITTLAQATAWAEGDWREAARRGGAGERWAVFVAEVAGADAAGGPGGRSEGGGLVGMATGHFPDEGHRALDGPTIVSLIQMWVDPRLRRSGVGRRLVEAVRGWAATRGSARVRLGVNDADPGALAFYEALGFRDTGRREEVVERRLRAIEMEAPSLS